MTHKIDRKIFLKNQFVPIRRHSAPVKCLSWPSGRGYRQVRLRRWAGINNNNNNPICKAPECQKTSWALVGFGFPKPTKPAREARDSYIARLAGTKPDQPRFTIIGSGS